MAKNEKYNQTNNSTHDTDVSVSLKSRSGIIYKISDTSGKYQ